MGFRRTPMRGSPHCEGRFSSNGESAAPRDGEHMIWKEGSVSRVVSSRGVFWNCLLAVVAGSAPHPYAKTRVPGVRCCVGPSGLGAAEDPAAIDQSRGRRSKAEARPRTLISTKI